MIHNNSLYGEQKPLILVLGSRGLAGWKRPQVPSPANKARYLRTSLTQLMPVSTVSFCIGTLPESYSRLEALQAFDAHGNNLTGGSQHCIGSGV